MASKDDIIAELREIVAAQAKQIEDLENRIGDLELKLAKAQKNSTNSSKSPSSDITNPPAKKKNVTGKRKKAKRGGQKGHKQKLRKPLPPECVDERITYEINDTDIREHDLTPTDQFEIVQHVELLDMPIHVTEHRLRTYLNPDGETFLPHVPELRNQPIFGPRMLAMIGWLKSRAHCSYRASRSGWTTYCRCPYRVATWQNCVMVPSLLRWPPCTNSSNRLSPGNLALAVMNRA